MKHRWRTHHHLTPSVLVRIGSVLDIGATAMPRRARLTYKLLNQTPADAVSVDWDVVAREFNRVARGKSSPADQ